MLDELEPYRVADQERVRLFRAAQKDCGPDVGDSGYRVGVLKIAPLSRP